MRRMPAALVKLLSKLLFSMLLRMIYPLAVTAAAVLLVSACASTSTTDPYGETESRVYQAVYNRAVERVAQAAVDAGLEVQDSGVQSGSTYAINAVRLERLNGSSEPIQVAQVEIFVDKLQGGTVRVRVKQRKVTRTSTMGTSSANQRDYARRIFRRLDDRMQQATSPEA
jgi:hypothetical protein